MKNFILNLVLLSSTLVACSQPCTINDACFGSGSRDASAQVTINATNQGFLVPRMTAAQKAAISSPATGLLIYQTNSASGFYYYTGAAWVPIASGSSVAWGDTITGSPDHPFEIVTFDANGNIYSDSNLTFMPQIYFLAEILTDSSDGVVEIAPGYTSLFSSTLSGDSLSQIILNNGLNWGDQDALGIRYVFKTSGNSKTYLFPTDTGSVGQVLSIAANDAIGNNTLAWSNGVGGCEISCGTYTPTLTNTANLDGSTAFVCQYMQVGSTVTVSGAFNADATAAATATSLRMTLPIASNLAGGEEIGGTAATVNATTSEFAQIVGNLPNDEATIQWISDDVTEQFWSFSFTYQIIP